MSTTNPTTPITEPTLAQQQAAGLRALADMIEANPEVAPYFNSTLGYTNVSVSSFPDPQGAIATLIRAGMRHGATVAKRQDDEWGGVELQWPAVNIHVYARRELICERVVTGTEIVTTTVPDPAALAEVPTVEVTETVETVEWVCRPLLAATGEATDVVGAGAH